MALKNKYNLKEIPIKKELGNKLAVAIVQLKSPFDEELYVTGDNVTVHKKFNVVQDITKKKWEERKKRIDDILKNLLKKCKDSKPKRKINIIIFPEYSIPQSIIDSLKKFSIDKDIIIIGNYYDKNKRASISFVATMLFFSSTTRRRLNFHF